jgi:hypothetical protein
MRGLDHGWYERRKRSTKERQQPKAFLDEIYFCLGFDDKEEVGVGEARGKKLLARFVEGFGQNGENNFAFGASYEMEAKLFVDELELTGHSCCAILCAFGSIHRSRDKINRDLQAGHRNLDLYQFGTDAAEGKAHGLELEFATVGQAAQAKSTY